MLDCQFSLQTVGSSNLWFWRQSITHTFHWQVNRTMYIFFGISFVKRDFTIEKRFPLKGFHYWLKVRPHYRNWPFSLNWKKGYSFELHRRKEEFERHLVYFMISRCNSFSIIISLLLRYTDFKIHATPMIYA